MGQFQPEILRLHVVLVSAPHKPATPFRFKALCSYGHWLCGKDRTQTRVLRLATT